MYNTNITYQRTLSLEKTQEERVLATNQLVFAHIFKTSRKFQAIHSIVTLGNPDDHFRDGFQAKQAVSWPIPLAQNMAA